MGGVFNGKKGAQQIGRRQSRVHRHHGVDVVGPRRVNRLGRIKGAHPHHLRFGEAPDSLNGRLKGFDRVAEIGPEGNGRPNHQACPVGVEPASELSVLG